MSAESPERVLENIENTGKLNFIRCREFFHIFLVNLISLGEGEENSENAWSSSSSTPVKTTATRANRKRKALSQIIQNNQDDDDVDPESSPTPPKHAKGLISELEAKEEGFDQVENIYEVEAVLMKRTVDGKVIRRF